MFNVIYDFFLILVFFATFKLADIYMATIAVIICSTLQVMITRIWLKRFDKKQVILLAILTVFGGMTLYFHNPIFIKWKPTVVFWLLGAVFFISHFIGGKPLTERMMAEALGGKKPVPKSIWKCLNLAWALFFAVLGSVNLFIAYHFSTDIWVNFKVYGILGSVMMFAVVQSIYLAKYVVDEK